MTESEPVVLGQGWTLAAAQRGVASPGDGPQLAQCPYGTTQIRHSAVRAAIGPADHKDHIAAIPL